MSRAADFRRRATARRDRLALDHTHPPCGTSNDRIGGAEGIGQIANEYAGLSELMTARFSGRPEIAGPSQTYD
jgi:hypothetical protein